jgi:hypothetical protein
LHKAGLTAGEAPKTWKSESRDAAHRIPDLMAIWEPVRKLTDGMEFLHLQPAGVGTA